VEQLEKEQSPIDTFIAGELIKIAPPLGPFWLTNKQSRTSRHVERPSFVILEPVFEMIWQLERVRVAKRRRPIQSLSEGKSFRRYGLRRYGSDHGKTDWGVLCGGKGEFPANLTKPKSVFYPTAQ
jgi:hypothetical protein